MLHAGPTAVSRRLRIGDVLDGWRYILAHPALSPLSFNTILVRSLIMAPSPLLAVHMLGPLGFAPWQYGLAFALPCVGGLAGSRLAHRLVARFSQHKVMLTAARGAVAAPLSSTTSAAVASRSSTRRRVRPPLCRPTWSNARSSHRRCTGPGPWSSAPARSAPRYAPSSTCSVTASATWESTPRATGCPTATHTGSRQPRSPAEAGPGCRPDGPVHLGREAAKKPVLESALMPVDSFSTGRLHSISRPVG